MGNANDTRLLKIGGIWSYLCRVCRMEQKGAEGIERFESPVSLLPEKERILSLALTTEQRREYDSAARNSSSAIEEIRVDGERRAEAIVSRNCKEAVNKMLFVVA